MKKIQSLVYLLMILLLSLSIATTGMAQNSPYQTTLGKELPLLGVGTLGFGSSVFLQAKNKPLSETTINQLNANDVWQFDRSATRNWSTKAAHASDIAMYTSFALPFALLAGQDIRSNSGQIALLCSEAFLINLAATNLTKNLSKRIRPFVYNPNAPLERKLKKDAQFSFFSGHTSGSAVMCFFTAKVFSDFYPDSKFKPYAWAMAATLPAFTGYMRYKAGKHYFSDILVGYAVGAFVGFIVPHIHKKSSSPNSSFTPNFNIVGSNNSNNNVWVLNYTFVF